MTAERDYASALAEFVATGDEAALAVAYEFGRRAASSEEGVVGLAGWHHDAIALAMANAPHGEAIAKAGAFFAEAVAPLEMALRGYREANGRLLELNRALETAKGELEAFNYSVAHDLRAPLRAIDGFSATLAEDHGPRLDDGAQRLLRRIRDAADEMARMIDALLSLSRLTQADLRRQHVSLSTLAEACFARLRERDPHREVTTRVEPGIDATADARLLAIALDNLLGNAWKFTARRADAEITVGGRVEGNTLTYFVRDNGAGFDPAYAHRLFTVFQRLHSRREFEGTGIGLATVARVVHRHGGRIWAEGRDGAGATFWFTLEPE